jgi:hypothetical protein
LEKFDVFAVSTDNDPATGCFFTAACHGNTAPADNLQLFKLRTEIIFHESVIIKPSLHTVPMPGGMCVQYFAEGLTRVYCRVKAQRLRLSEKAGEQAPSKAF